MYRQFVYYRLCKHMQPVGNYDIGQIYIRSFENSIDDKIPVYTVASYIKTWTHRRAKACLCVHVFIAYSRVKNMSLNSFFARESAL